MEEDDLFFLILETKPHLDCSTIVFTASLDK